MLLSTTGLFIEFARFIQVILWIVLPILLLSSLVTYLIHRTKLKKARSTTNTEGPSFFTSMENPGHGAYVLFDHSGLIRKYRNKLSYNQARYFALKHDFDKLEAKYVAMANSYSSLRDNNKKYTMNTTSISGRNENEYMAENKELAERLEQLTQSYKTLEEENESLLEQINLQTASEDEKSMIVNRWREENTILKNKAAEQEYLQDIVEEKKRQIDFLQQQLEQRIRSYHHSEQQQSALKKEQEHYKEVQQDHLKELDALRNELTRKEELLAEKTIALSAQADQSAYMENVLAELKQQNDLLNAALADSRDATTALQGQLALEQSRVATAEQKLASNRQMLQRLHKEFTAFMDGDQEPAPMIITMHPDYAKDAEL